MADQNNAPERIWLDEGTFNGAVGFAHSKQHHPGDWAEYIRADRAAPTDNTALVEAAQAMVDLHNGPASEKRPDVFQRRIAALAAALASREAPPAAQEPVAWRYRDPEDDKWRLSDDRQWMAYRQSKVECEVQPLYAAPPPACQQEAVTVAEAAAARAENERLTKELDEATIKAECWETVARKMEDYRDEALALLADAYGAGTGGSVIQSHLADAERDMRQRAADVCDGYANGEKLKPAKGWSDDEAKHWETGGVDHLLAAMDAILSLPLKHADREGGV